MKQSAFLAISALSLGVAGLGAFVPVVSAANPGDTTVTATVQPTFGVSSAANATITLSPGGDKQESKEAAVVAQNNSGNTANLTVNTVSDVTNMVSASDSKKTIPASANISAGNPGWGLKTGNNTYVAVPAAGQTGVNVATISSGPDTTTPVVYGASSSVTTAAADDYAVTVVYSLTAQSGN